MRARCGRAVAARRGASTCERGVPRSKTEGAGIKCGARARACTDGAPPGARGAFAARPGAGAVHCGAHGPWGLFGARGRPRISRRVCMGVRARCATAAFSQVLMTLLGARRRADTPPAVRSGPAPAAAGGRGGSWGRCLLQARPALLPLGQSGRRTSAPPGALWDWQRGWCSGIALAGGSVGLKAAQPDFAGSRACCVLPAARRPKGNGGSGRAVRPRAHGEGLSAGAGPRHVPGGSAWPALQEPQPANMQAVSPLYRQSRLPRVWPCYCEQRPPLYRL